MHTKSIKLSSINLLEKKIYMLKSYLAFDINLKKYPDLYSLLGILLSLLEIVDIRIKKPQVVIG